MKPLDWLRTKAAGVVRIQEARPTVPSSEPMRCPCGVIYSRCYCGH